MLTQKSHLKPFPFLIAPSHSLIKVLTHDHSHRIFCAILTGFWVIYVLLGSLLFPLQEWDESRHIQNALEMLHTGHFWQLTFNHSPDTWNLKPLPGIWAQAAASWALGKEIWVFRLPSAVSLLIFVLLLYHWLKDHLARHQGFWICTMLLTSKGLAGWHMGWTADMDAPLLMCMTLVLYCGHQILRSALSSTIPWIHAWGIFIGLGLGFGFKGWAVLQVLPPLCFLVYFYLSIHTKLIWPILCVGLFLLVCLLGAAFYFNALPWLERSLSVDILQRWTQPLDGNGVFGLQNNLLWLPKQWQLLFFPWIYVLLFSLLLLSFFQKANLVKQWKLWASKPARLYFLVFITSNLVAILSSHTKTFWYAVPSGVFLMTAMGLLIFQVCNPSYLTQFVALLGVCLCITLVNHFRKTLRNFSNQNTEIIFAKQTKSEIKDFKKMCFVGHPSPKQRVAFSLVYSTEVFTFPAAQSCEWVVNLETQSVSKKLSQDN